MQSRTQFQLLSLFILVLSCAEEEYVDQRTASKSHAADASEIASRKTDHTSNRSASTVPEADGSTVQNSSGKSKQPNGSAPPQIISQPEFVTFTLNQPIKISVDVVVDDKATFVWEKDDVPIDGQNSATFAIASPTAADIGKYILKVTTPNGSAKSKAIGLVPGDMTPVFSNDADSIVKITSMKLDETSAKLSVCFKFAGVSGYYPSSNVLLLAKYILSLKVDGGSSLPLTSREMLSSIPNPYFYAARNKCFDFAFPADLVTNLRAKYPLGNVPFSLILRGGVSKNGPPLTGGIRSIPDATKASGMVFISR
jgi:hypothetical protein